MTLELEDGSKLRTGKGAKGSGHDLFKDRTSTVICRCRITPSKHSVRMASTRPMIETQIFQRLIT
jgi:hypothetical protein